MVTGSDDGYIRDYDIFSAVNGKNFLTAPQRSHSGVVEGIMKSGQIRSWWGNPSRKLDSEDAPDEERGLAPVYSMSMHSDALWMLAGTGGDVCIRNSSIRSILISKIIDRKYQSLHSPPRTRPSLSRYDWPPWPCLCSLNGSRRERIFQCGMGRRGFGEFFMFLIPKTFSHF
jgi:hypothetical protein